MACPELREIDFGKIEGLKFDEIQSTFPELARQMLNRDPSLSYPDGESLHSLDARVKSFLPRLDSIPDKQTVLIVAHSAVLRTLVCYLLQIELAHRWDYRMGLASLSIVDGYPPKGSITLLNDMSHLEEANK